MSFQQRPCNWMSSQKEVSRTQRLVCDLWCELTCVFSLLFSQDICLWHYRGGCLHNIGLTWEAHLHLRLLSLNSLAGLSGWIGEYGAVCGFHFKTGFHAGWCGSMDWVLACKPKDHQFNSQSGHMPGLWARSPVRGVWEATNQGISCTLMFLSLSFTLPSTLSKNK